MQDILDFCSMLIESFLKFSNNAVRFFTTEINIKLGNVEFFSITPIDLLVEVFFVVVIARLIAEFVS